MKSGYDQFFKNAKQVADGKPTSVKFSSQLRQKAKKRRERKKFPVGALFISVFGFIAAYAGYENYEKIHSLINRVDVSLFSIAGAEESHASDVKPASSEASTFTKPVAAEPTGEELNHLLKLVERKKELDAREEEITRMEAEMAKQKEELQKKVSDLEKMRNSISSILEERVKADDQKVDTLVQFYSNMKAPQAAKIFETLDEDLAVQILGRMKKKNAAEVLNLMKAEKAQMFTEKFAGYKRSVASQNDAKKDQTDSNNNETETPAATKP